jgi:hypothetical protein
MTKRNAKTIIGLYQVGTKKKQIVRINMAASLPQEATGNIVEKDC